MTPPILPPELAAARDRLLEGVSRRGLRDQAAALSQRYRSVAGAHAKQSELLAYTVTRMPATYAAVAAVLDEVSLRMPGFSPRTLLDLGSGPGTATWAAAAVFGQLDSVTAIERESGFTKLAVALAETHPLLSRATRIEGNLEQSPAIFGGFDLVTAAFVLAEILPDRQAAMIAAAWDAAGVLVLVEPGTPAGFARILSARTQIIALGGKLVAPCPHGGPCPLGGDDWCHFAVRLPRERDHREVKNVASPFEDEKYAYAVLSREPVTAIAGRILRPPKVTKADITADLCTPAGLAAVRIPARDREAHRRSRKWRWGTALE